VKLVMRETRRPRKAKKEASDPVVAYELSLWMAFNRVVFVALTDSLTEAKSMCYDLEMGPYTTKDFDFRPITASQRGVLKGK
jgi:hypothetical protein